MSRRFWTALAILALAAAPARAKLSEVKSLQLFVDVPASMTKDEVEVEVRDLFRDYLPDVRLGSDYAEVNLQVSFGEAPAADGREVAYSHKMRLFGNGSDKVGMHDKVYWFRDIDGVVEKGRADKEWRRSLKRLVKELAESFGEDESFVAEVIGVSDGDTLNVFEKSRTGSVRIVRLNSVDCPEKDQRSGPEAKKFTSELSLGKTITVKVDSVDRYGRVLGEAILPGGKSLNRELLKAGWAWWYNQYSKDSTLADLESAAEEAGIGLWADKDPTPPWEWRKTHRK
jgi:endonuclease YncB( thermonuclease family)